MNENKPSELNSQPWWGTLRRKRQYCVIIMNLKVTTHHRNQFNDSD